MTSNDFPFAHHWNLVMTRLSRLGRSLSARLSTCWSVRFAQLANGALLVALCGTFAATSAAAAAATDAPLDVSIVYLGNPGDAGWTHAHDLGIGAAEKQLGSQIKVTRIDDVPENADAARCSAIVRRRATRS